MAHPLDTESFTYKRFYIVSNDQEVRELLENFQSTPRETEHVCPVTICEMLDRQVLDNINSRFLAMFIFITPALKDDNEKLYGCYAITKYLVATAGGKVERRKFLSTQDPELLTEVEAWLKENCR